LIVVGAVSHTFTAAVIHLIDATSSDPVIQPRGLKSLKFCFVALGEMANTWSWSHRVRRALQALCGQWLPSQFGKDDEASEAPSLARSAPLSPCKQRVDNQLEELDFDDSIFKADVWPGLDGEYFASLFAPNEFDLYDQSLNFDI
jgi:hypothetical protein